MQERHTHTYIKIHTYILTNKQTISLRIYLVELNQARLMKSNNIDDDDERSLKGAAGVDGAININKILNHDESGSQSGPIQSNIMVYKSVKYIIHTHTNTHNNKISDILESRLSRRSVYTHNSYTNINTLQASRHKR